MPCRLRLNDHRTRLTSPHSLLERTNMNINGRQIVILEQNAVAADVVACLAGVSFGSVIKVIWAMKTIHEISGIPFEQLLDNPYDSDATCRR